MTINTTIMRFSAMRTGLLACFVLFVATLLWWQLPQRLVQAGTCANGSAIDETFTTGARWELCWSEQTHEGIVLSDLYYTPPDGPRRKVLKTAALSQIEVLYDDGRAALHHVGSPGLGGAQLLSLTAAECPAGTLLHGGDRTVLCQQVGPRGYLYKYYTVQRQGQALTLFSVSQIGQLLYIVQWRFFDDGTIEPQVADGGRLLRLGTDGAYGWPVTGDNVGDNVDETPQVGIGYITNYWWRLDFDLAENGANDFVDEFNVNPISNNTQLATSVTTLNTETGRTTDPTSKRSWRVRDGAITNPDGHAISYHLEPKQAGYRYQGPATEPWSQHDLYATVAQPCERLPIDNGMTLADPATCSDHIAAFVNDESLAGADVVLWYRITTHRLPRPEDTPVLGVEWHGYQLLPRDWTAQNPF